MSLSLFSKKMSGQLKPIQKIQRAS